MEWLDPVEGADVDRVSEALETLLALASKPSPKGKPSGLNAQANTQITRKITKVLFWLLNKLVKYLFLFIFVSKIRGKLSNIIIQL